MSDEERFGNVLHGSGEVTVEAKPEALAALWCMWNHQLAENAGVVPFGEPCGPHCRLYPVGSGSENTNR